MSPLGVILLSALLALAPARPQDSKQKPQDAKPERTDAYGDPLPRGATARMGTVRLRHLGMVTCVAFSHDSKRLASGGLDGFVRIWNPSSGKSIDKFSGFDGWSNAVAFSPDGSLLAYGGFHMNGGPPAVRIREFDTGKEVARLVGHLSAIRSIVFSPDGETLATGSNDKTVRLWEVSSGKQLHELSHKGMVRAVVFSSDGRIVASGGKDDPVRLWETDTGKQRHELRAHKEGVQSVAISPDEKTLASAGGRMVILWEIETGKEIRRFEGTEEVFEVAFSPGGETLAVSRGDHNIAILDVSTGKERMKLIGGPTVSTSYPLAFSPDGKMLASASPYAIRLWDLSSDTPQQEPQGHEDMIQSIAFSPDGKSLATGGGAVARLWEVASGKERLNFHLKNYTSKKTFSVDSVQFTAGGRLLACEIERVLKGQLVTTKVRLWDVLANRVETTLEPTESYLYHVAFSSDGKTMASGHPDSTILLWDVETGREQKKLVGHGWRVYSIAFSPDGKTLASGGHNATARLWQIATGRSLHTLRGHGSPVPEVVFSPDGRTLATRSDDGNIRLWSVAKGNEILMIKGDDKTYVSKGSVAFSPDGRWLAAAKGKSIRLWELATGDELLTLNGHEGSVVSVAFSPDGRSLASASSDTTALLWDLSASTGDPKAASWDLDRVWADLVDDDAAKAYRAIWTLAAAKGKAVAYLKDRVLPAPIDQKRIRRLISDLDNDEVSVRDKAAKGLIQIGVQAESELIRALGTTASPEVRTRLQRLLDALISPVGLPSKAVHRIRSIQVLELIGDQAARELLKELGTRDAQAALKRLIARDKRVERRR